jgi:hypothetical protein
MLAISHVRRGGDRCLCTRSKSTSGRARKCTACVRVFSLFLLGVSECSGAEDLVQQRAGRGDRVGARRARARVADRGSVECVRAHRERGLWHRVCVPEQP